jgi:hypothetical protein
MAPWTPFASQSNWKSSFLARRKSLYLAVGNSVAGHENWDNNSGRYHHVQIVREKVLKANKETVVEDPPRRRSSARFLSRLLALLLLSLRPPRRLLRPLLSTTASALAAFVNSTPNLYLRRLRP